MHSWWLGSLTGDKQEEFKEAFAQSRLVREKLAEKLDKDLAKLDTYIDKMDPLELPNSKDVLISKLAERRAIKALRKLLEV